MSAGAGVARSTDGNIVGAGSTFAAPLMTAWYQYYNPKAGTNVSYNSIGSGGGIASITARTVDFGASDAPLTPDQFTNCKSCIQIPVLLGATAVLYNVPGVTQQLKLTGPVIADIYLGKITQWNDAKIAALNTGVNLPELEDHAGVPVGRIGHELQLHRLPVEGELGVCRARSGKSTQPPFPARRRRARQLRRLGRREATRRVPLATPTSRTRLTNKLRFAKVRNKAGVFATPGIRAATAAASTIKTMPADNAVSIVDPPVDEEDEARLSDQHVHMGDRAARGEERKGAQAVHPLRDQQARAAARCEVALRADPGRRPGRGCEEHREDQAGRSVA